MKRKIPKQATKREIETMLSQIENNDSIAIFNARKALYIYVDESSVIDEMVQFLKDKLEKLDD